MITDGMKKKEMMSEDDLSKLVSREFKKIDRFMKVRKVGVLRWRLMKHDTIIAFLQGVETFEGKFFFTVEWEVNTDLHMYAPVRDAYTGVVSSLNSRNLLVEPNRTADFRFELAPTPEFPWNMKHLAPFYKIIPNNFRSQSWCESQRKIRNNLMLIHPDSHIPLTLIPAALYKIKNSGFTYDERMFSAPEILDQISLYETRSDLAREVLGKPLPLS